MYRIVKKKTFPSGIKLRSWHTEELQNWARSSQAAIVFLTAILVLDDFKFEFFLKHVLDFSTQAKDVCLVLFCKAPTFILYGYAPTTYTLYMYVISDFYVFHIDFHR